jgi:hypothetical protein
MRPHNETLSVRLNRAMDGLLTDMESPASVRQDVSYVRVTRASAILGDKHPQKLARPVSEKIALGQQP